MGFVERARARLFGPKKDEGAPAGLSVWMDPIEWSQVQAIVHTLAPKSMVEWGSGGSTKAFLEMCPYLDRLVSVEHNQEWYARVRDDIVDPRLEYHHVAPAVEEPQFVPNDREALEVLIAWGQRCEDDRSVMRDYIDLPAGLGQQFDLAFVDGRARVFCLEAGWKLLAPGGILMLHDAQRTQYHETFARLGDPIYLEPYKQGQVAFLRKPDAPVG